MVIFHGICTGLAVEVAFAHAAHTLAPTAGHAQPAQPSALLLHNLWKLSFRTRLKCG